MISHESLDVQEVIEALARSADDAARLLRDLSEPALRARNSPDEFSALENICHLRDIEVEGYRVRVNKILTEDKPILPDIDGGRLAIDRAYNNQNVDEALEAFALARRQNIVVLMQVNDEQLKRSGFMTGVGEITLEKLLVMMRDHDEDHLEELRRIRQQTLKSSFSEV
jgi:hypothetical protein